VELRNLDQHCHFNHT